MKILYIDNRDYHHNVDIHVNFFSFVSIKKYHVIYPYGKYLHKFFKNAIKPGDNPNKELKELEAKIKPDCIITYNCNGSSYEVKLDNINLYSWCETFLKSTKIPKFHVTTDFCRDGYRKEQANWFSDLGYSAALFRHNESLKYQLDIPKYWLPFSVDQKMYDSNSLTDIKAKVKKVGFVGAAHNSSKSLYQNRIAAIDFLLDKKKLAITKIIDDGKFERKIIIGNDYITFLTQNLFGLTCGGTCNFMTAKYFQIPAARSMLICTDTNGLNLFPKDTYIKYDKNHLDDMYDQILFYEKHLKETKAKIGKLHDYVMENHSHDKRATELTRIIKKYI